MQKTKKFRRLLAALLAVLMLSIGIPAMAFAKGDESGTQKVGINYYIAAEDRYVEGSVTVDAAATCVNTSALTDVPEGYKPVNAGDVQINDGWIYVELKAVATTQEVGVNYYIPAEDRYVEGSVTVDAAATCVNTSALTDVPEGYKPVNAGDVQINDGWIYVELKAVATTQKVGVNYYIPAEDRYVEGSVTVDAAATCVNTSALTDVPEGYKPVNAGDVQINDGWIYVELKAVATTQEVGVNYYIAAEDRYVEGSVTVDAAATCVNTSALTDVPEGYKPVNAGDVQINDGWIYVELKAVATSTDVIMNVQFKDGDEVVAGGDYFLPEGVQNYSVLQKYVPEGYKMSVSGDFTVTDGGKIEVRVEKISTSTDVIMNVQFKDGDEVVAGGDYFLPEGVQNYSVLEQYLPDGYKLSVSGDFMVAEGTSLDVRVEKIVKDVIMNIRFMDGDTFVSGGDYFLPKGVQNYSVLEQYLPDGYKLSVSGDFMVAEGTSLDVRVEKIVKDVIMNIRFMDGDEFVAGGDYFLPEGVQNYSVLEQYVPVGYQMSVSGDFMVAEGTSLDVRVEKVNDAIIVNIAFVDPYGNVIAGGDYFVPAGVQNRQVLDRYVPQGYKQAVTGDILFEAGEHYDINLVEDTSIVNIQFIDMEGNVIAGGDYFVPTGIHNRTVLNQYVPEGYYQVVTGDIQFIYGQHYEIVIDRVPETATAKTAVFRKGENDVWNENPDNPDEVHYTFWSFDPDEPCTVPSITTGDKSKALDYWVCDLDETVTLQPGEDFCYNDLDQGKLEGCSGDFAFYPVYKDVTTASNTNTVTASSDDSSDEVVKAEAPADNSTKILPQTGNQGVVSPVSFVVVLCAALAGAAVYLFAIRKKLN